MHVPSVKRRGSCTGGCGATGGRAEIYKKKGGAAKSVQRRRHGKLGCNVSSHLVAVGYGAEWKAIGQATSVTGYCFFNRAAKAALWL
jgi:hypothetical protein